MKFRTYFIIFIIAYELTLPDHAPIVFVIGDKNDTDIFE